MPKNKSSRSRIILFSVLVPGIILITTSISLFSFDSVFDKKQDRTEISWPEALNQADQILSGLTLRQKIGQLLVISAHGNYYANDHERLFQLRQMVDEHQVGGVIFFRGDIYNQAVLTNKLQEVSNIPLWIAQDMEYGAAMRVNESTRITPAMGVAATGDPRWAYEKGRITAIEARALGVHQVYAPVVDVNNNPANPVINVRSFSEDPETVSVFAEAFIRGVQEEGIMATAKHFPGHGDTGTDSHLALPVITHGYERLNSIELFPFRRTIDAGVKSIMSAHIAFPAIGTNPRLPATLDPRFITHILQDSLGFDGLIVTDALEMRGIANHFSPGEAVIAALNAGNDVMLLSPDELTAINEIERAVHSGRLEESRIDHSVRKILAYKIEHGLMDHKLVDVSAISSNVNIRAHQAIADEIARQSITLLRNRGDVLPIRPERYPRIMFIAISNHESGTTGRDFNRAMGTYHPGISFFNYDSRTSDRELDEMIASARQANLVIIGSYLHLATGARLSFNNTQRQFINRINALGKPTALVSFSSPYIVTEMPNADVHLLAWSMAGSQPDAAASALFGASEIQGRLPITIPGHYVRNHGITVPKIILRNDIPESVGLSAASLRNIDNIMNRAVADSVFPGGVVAVVRNGVLAYNRPFGYVNYDNLERVTATSMYDLASLTKPLATALSVMMLVDEGKLRLYMPVSNFFPEFRSGDRAGVTIEHLLAHTSGLPAFRTYVDTHKTRGALLNAIKNEPLLNKPGTTILYSDLGYILLGEIVAQVSGLSFDEYLSRNLFGPLRLHSTMFNPASRGARIRNRTVPTEIDTVFRNKAMRGEVHDERAYYLGGVAGHAGLFSTTGNLAVLMDLIMQGGAYGGREYIKPETMALFTERKAGHTRALGFDLKSLDGFTTAGSLSSDNTFGHLGFTGTSFWIDPERDLAVIILTNRTWPHRGTSAGINRVRSAIMDAAINAIIEQP